MTILNGCRTWTLSLCRCRRWWRMMFCGVLSLLLYGCGASGPDNVLKVGLSEEPRTLNIWLAGDANSKKVLSQIYQTLYYRDPSTLALIPWLAAELPVYDATQHIYTVKLRPSLKWSDGRPMTAHDVAFTGRLIQSFQVPRYASKWRLVEQITAVDETTIQFLVKKPYASFLSSTLMAPIVPKHQWQDITEQARASQKQLAALLNYEIAEPVGSGPFMFKQWQQGNFIYLEKNPHFFAPQTALRGHVLGPYINGILFKIYGTMDVGVLALRRGDIDLFWRGIQPGYLKQLSAAPQIKVYESKTSAMYYMGFNTRRAPFSDAVVRKAIATLIDKQFIVQRILQGTGNQMDAIIPPGNVQWYNDNVIRHGEGLSRPDRIQKAYRLLSQAGYTWKTPPIDPQGQLQKADTIYLPDGAPMPAFNLLTPPADYDPLRAMSGTMIQEWLREMGMPVYARPMHFGSLLQKIKANHDFDVFILGYGRLPLDPDYLRNFFISDNDKLSGWNMSGYHNPDFDRLAVHSQSEMNPDLRRKMIHDMQRILSQDLPYLPLYNPGLLEAVRTDRFTGWLPMIDGIGNRWSFCLVKPIEPAEEETAKRVRFR